MDTNTCTNNVMQEFGGLLPETLLAFEDAKREFLYTRALELQKLGLSTTNKTVIEAEMVLDSLDGEVLMPPDVATLMPAAVEFQPTNQTVRFPVGIVEVDDIPNYSGNRVIAFYGDPLKYRLAWDAWNEGTIYLFYDPVEDITAIEGGDTITFPPVFWTLLIKKTALRCVSVLRLKLAWHDRVEDKLQLENIMGALGQLERSLQEQVAEWQEQFKRFINRNYQQGPYLRRSNVEINYRRGAGPFSTCE